MALDDQQLLQCYQQLHKIFPEDLHIVRPLIQLLRERNRIDLAQEIALFTARRMLASGKSAYAIAFLTLCQQLNHPNAEEIKSLYDMARFSLTENETAADHRESFSLIEHLSDDESQEFIQQGTLRQIEAGEVIVNQNEDSRTFYLILDGTVDIRMQLKDGASVTINSMRASNFFGEFACVYRLRRSASVVATTPALLLEFSDQSIAGLLEHSPLAGDYLIRTIKNRMIHAMTFTLPAFADVPDEDRLWVAEASDVDEYQQGESIPTTHSDHPSCDIILSGSAELLIHSKISGKARQLSLRQGACFGDASPLIKVPSNSRLVAQERTLICRIPEFVFQTLINVYGSFEQYIKEIH